MLTEIQTNSKISPVLIDNNPLDYVTQVYELNNGLVKFPLNLYLVFLLPTERLSYFGKS